MRRREGTPKIAKKLKEEQAKNVLLGAEFAWRSDFFGNGVNFNFLFKCVQIKVRAHTKSYACQRVSAFIRY